MTQRVLLLIGMMMAVAVVDGAWLSRLNVGAGPEPLIIVAVLAGLRYGVEMGALLGGVAGYIQDLVTGSPLGLHMFMFLVLGATAGGVRPVVDLQHRLLPAAAAVAATLAVTTVTALLALALHFGVVAWRGLGTDVVMTVGLNALIAGPMAGLMRWIDHLTQRRYTGRTIGHRVLR